MKDKIAWMVLTKGCKSAKKLKQLAESFEKRKKDVDFTEKAALDAMDELERAKMCGSGVVTYREKEYPEYLRHISNPPAYLYFKGNVKALNHPLKAAIVGSREASLYGINTATNFAYELSANNVAVISGGARGIDSAALNGALRGRAPAICVVGTGIDVTYPRENEKLFERIAEKGVVISELPLGSPPMAKNFPVRNRLMTALCDTLVVVEAAKKSGALITASYAGDYGKTLFAVPGNIDSPTSEGTNALLQDGALWALSGSDILYEMMERMPASYRKAMKKDEEIEEDIFTEPSNNALTHELKAAEEPKKENVSSGIERAVLNAIGEGKRDYDAILEYCACDAARLNSVLTLMQIKGMIKRGAGNAYDIIG